MSPGGVDAERLGARPALRGPPEDTVGRLRRRTAEVTGGGRARDFETARDHAIIRILRSEGIRRSELLGVTMHTLPADVIRNPAFRLVPLKGARADGEGRLAVLAPASARAQALYLRARRGHRLADSDWVLAGNPGPGPVRRYRYPQDAHPQGRAGRLCTRAAPSVSPHLQRHQFAGVPLRDVQEAASHADPRTTMRYDYALRPGTHQPGPPRYLHRRDLHRRSSPITRKPVWPSRRPDRPRPKASAPVDGGRDPGNSRDRRSVFGRRESCTAGKLRITGNRALSSGAGRPAPRDHEGSAAYLPQILHERKILRDHGACRPRLDAAEPNTGVCTRRLAGPPTPRRAPNRQAPWRCVD